MSQRNQGGLPRLSGRPTAQGEPVDARNVTVFRRFFDLIERLERPRAAPSNKAQPPAPPRSRR